MMSFEIVAARARLSLLLGAVGVLALSACSAPSIETSFPKTASINPAAERDLSKTLSSQILVGIALERVTGRRSFGEKSANANANGGSQNY